MIGSKSGFKLDAEAYDSFLRYDLKELPWN